MVERAIRLKCRFFLLWEGYLLLGAKTSALLCLQKALRGISAVDSDHFTPRIGQDMRRSVVRATGIWYVCNVDLGYIVFWLIYQAFHFHNLRFLARSAR